MKNKVLYDLYSIKDGTLEFENAESFNLCLKEEPVYDGQGDIEKNNLKLSIGNQKDIRKIVIPEGVEMLPSGCLKDFKHLEEIIGPSVKKLGDYSLCGCSNLKKTEFSPELHSIGYKSLYCCENLDSFYPEFIVKDGVLVEYMGTNEDITFSGSVTEIGDNTFKDNNFLTNIIISDSVTEIGQSAFENCTSLTNVTMSDSVKRIGWYAFENCKSLTNITIGNGVKSIGEKAFYRCTALTSATISESVESIGDYAFRDCFSLKSITFEGNPELNYSTFFCCSNLEEIIVRNEEMKQYLIENVSLPVGCEIKVVSKELEQSQDNDELTPLEDINLAPNVESLREACDEIMSSNGKMVYDEIDPNKSKDAR